MGKKTINFIHEEDKKIFILGNEAIARGLIEGGLQFAAAYPGTPTSEIVPAIAAFSDARKDLKLYAEWSSNEKVAMEVAIASSLTGLRTVFVCKHVGLNVAADPFMTLANMGTVGGLVLVIGDDPSCHSSQNEQDTRYYGIMATVPVLEPSTGQEAFEMARDAFELSEKFKLPVILRITTRIAHSKTTVKVGTINPKPRIPEFVRNMAYNNVPANARKNHIASVEKWAKIKELAEEAEWNRIEGILPAKYGIVTSGVSYSYVKATIDTLELTDTAILKIGLANPVPEKKIANFLKNTEEVIVIEEVYPVLETEIRAIAQANKITTTILGKHEGYTPYTFELNTRIVIEAFQNWLKIDKFNFSETDSESSKNLELIPDRGPVLCAGCPHRASFDIMKRALGKYKKDAIFSNDIGCYALGVLPPSSVADTILDMGASITVASGLSKTGISNKIVAIIGDSTFWHSGLTGLASAVYNKADFILLIVDNLTTAMTGMQGNPSSGESALADVAPEKLKIEDVVRSMGVETIIIDPWERKESIEAVKPLIEKNGVRCIISRRECMANVLRRSTYLESFKINHDECIACHACITQTGCPALIWDPSTKNLEKQKPMIDPTLCAACGLCAQICPKGAIKGKNIEYPEK